jgi:hypothetical protein
MHESGRDGSQPGDAAQDRLDSHWLGEERKATDLLLTFPHIDQRCEENYRDMGQSGIVTNFLRDLAAVGLRHIDVAKNDIRPKLTGRGAGPRTVVFLADDVTAISLQSQAEEAGKTGVIVDEQDSLRVHRVTGEWRKIKDKTRPQ